MNAKTKDFLNIVLERTVLNWKFDISIFLMCLTIIVLFMLAYIAAGERVYEYPSFMYVAVNIPNICLVMAMSLIFSLMAAMLEDRK